MRHPPYQEGQPRLERRNGEGVFAKVVPARKGLLGNYLVETLHL